jgi:hypothetical protein
MSAWQPPNWIVNEPSGFGFAVRLFKESDIRQIAGHFEAIFRSVEARCKEIQPMTGCAGRQSIGLAASKRWNASLGLPQDTLRPSSLPIRSR